MENHGIKMKGSFIMQNVSGPNTPSANDEARIIYNVSNSLNGSPDPEGQYRLCYAGRTSGGGRKWLRPLVANDDDKPDADDSTILGSATYRFRAIYSKEFYGQVRYS